MNLNEVLVLARQLMDQHELVRWKLELSNSKSNAGVCKYGSGRKDLNPSTSFGTIELSRHYMTAFDEAHVRNTILHEIAHALTPNDGGHGKEWKAKAISIGCDGRRCVSPDAPKIQGRYRLICAAGHETPRHRWSENLKSSSCNRCSKRYDPRYGFDIYENGRLIHKRIDPSQPVSNNPFIPKAENPTTAPTMTAADFSKHHSKYLQKFMEGS